MAPKVAIIGAGIAGLTTAIALQKFGIEFTVFEASTEIKPVGAGLVLAANAIKAFDRLGIKQDVIAKGSLVDKFIIYDQAGAVISCIDSKAMNQKYGDGNFTILRSNLHEILLSKIPMYGLITGKRTIDYEKTKSGISLMFEDGTNFECDYVIVAEGINSPLRKKIVPAAQTRYAGHTCWRAIIDNSSLAIHETSESWGSNGRFGIVPLTDQKIYWFACINAPENDAVMKSYKVKDLRSHFSNFHAPIPSILQATDDKNLIWNDILDLKPMSHFAYGNIVFIGDAAHATTPNMGQGACQAIEDAVILADEMYKTKDWAEAFKGFEKRRLKRVKYIVDNSRNLGKIAQIENSILIKIRNFMLRRMPKAAQNLQFKKLFTVDF